MKTDGVRNTFLVALKNYGPREETVIRVFLYAWPNGTKLTQSLYGGGGLLIPSNTIANLTFTPQGFIWEPDRVYAIGVTTSIGFTMEATFRSSKDP